MSSELEGWINDKNEFVLPFDTMNFPKDTIFLKPISKIKFEKELNKAFHPKLVDNEKVIILDDYILGIKVKNWNCQNGNWETTVYIKNKKTITNN